MSGILAGIFALIAAYLAYLTVYSQQDYTGYRMAILDSGKITLLILIAVITLILSIGAGIFFTVIKAKKQHQNLWDSQTKRLLINLAIPLVTGGILSLILLVKGYTGLMAPLTLIFYGLALINASKYTLTEIRSLGILEVCLGLLATHFIGYGLIFWSIGFGIMHIVYGIMMQIRYGS
jgi:hypothetical protein